MEGNPNSDFTVVGPFFGCSLACNDKAKQGHADCQLVKKEPSVSLVYTVLHWVSMGGFCN